MSEKLQKLLNELKSASNHKQAQNLSRFFKTEKGQYGYGDLFLGIKVPVQRKIAKNYFDLSLTEIAELLESKIHEHRLVALVILDNKYKNSDTQKKEKIYNFYLKNYKNINNWDLVDVSAPNIVGQWLLKNPKDILYKLANSNNLWQKRISIISTLSFIREKQLDDTFAIAEILLNDEHDLIHKAVGWMLREAGKRDEKKLKQFLDKHCKQMPRTMLRYSIEKFNKKDYQHYLICSKP